MYMVGQLSSVRCYVSAILETSFNYFAEDVLFKLMFVFIPEVAAFQ